MERMSYRCLDLLVVLLLIALTACQQTSPPAPKKVSIPYDYIPASDSILTQMLIWESTGQLSLIKPYLQDDNPNYRYQALKSYCVPRPEHKLTDILPLLLDSIRQVRELAIFAVGQYGDREAIPYLETTFHGMDSIGQFHYENQLILEAVGKCGGPTQVDQLTSITTYRHEDSLLINGQIKALMHLMNRHPILPATIELISKYYFSPQYARSTRRLAGYYLARCKDIDLSNSAFSLGKVLNSESDPVLRILATRIMRRMQGSDFAATLTQHISREKDPQVRQEIAMTLVNQSYGKSKSAMQQLLKDKDIVVASAAGQFFLRKGQVDEVTTLWDKIKDQSYSPIVKAYLAGATMTHMPFYYALTRDAATRMLHDVYNKSSDPYEKAQLAKVIAQVPGQASWLMEQFDASNETITNSTIISSMSDAMEAATFHQSSTAPVRQAIKRLGDLVLKSKDPGYLAAYASLLRADDGALTEVFTRHQEMNAILSTLQMPRDIETYNEIVHLLHHYHYDSLTIQSPKSFIQFDPITYSGISSHTEAIVLTDKGEFRMKFYQNECPRTVEHMIRLIQSGYFDGKAFHRFVPNFVDQTGCPRGDGYGGLDQAMASEFTPLSYDEAGRLGMASIGPDTESCQWFITLMPTWHLDGRYTLFAYVSSGLDVIRQIRMGDRIKSIRLENFNI